VVALTSPKAFPSAVARQPNGVAPVVTTRSILREQKASKELSGKTVIGVRRQRPGKVGENEVEKSGSSEDSGSSDEDEGEGTRRGGARIDDEVEEVPAVNRVLFCARQFLKASRRFLNVSIDDSVKGASVRRLDALPQSAHEAAAAHDEATNGGQDNGDDHDDHKEEEDEEVSDGEDGIDVGSAETSGQAKKKRRLSAPLGAKGARDLMVEPLTDWVNASLTEQRQTLGAFNLALDRLTLSAVPKSLPCRENERARIDSLLRGAVWGGGGAPVVYISGMPGTGKTATVREVATALKAEARLGKVPPFTFVELNGMRLPQPEVGRGVGVSCESTVGINV